MLCIMINLHHYQLELFFVVIVIKLLELNRCFIEINTEFFPCVTSLNPNDSFIVFDKQKLI